LASFIHQPSTSEVDWVNFLDKKLRVPPDDDLRLVIHVEQEGRLNYAFISAYLQNKSPRCPYSQVSLFGANGVDPRRWFCMQVYPALAIFPELTEEAARQLIIDREQYCRPA
jgi:hypothetical protein